MNKTLICVSSPDNLFITNKEYTLQDGLLFTEQDFSINNEKFSDINLLLNYLKEQGYIFKLKDNYSSQSIHFNNPFDFGFGNIYNTQPNRQDAENLKNDILKDLLNGFKL